MQINAKTETIQPIQDYFAPGQFLNLSDADKLSEPSFEKYDAGVNIGSSANLNGQDSPRTVVYQERYIDDPAGLFPLTRARILCRRTFIWRSARRARDSLRW